MHIVGKCLQLFFMLNACPLDTFKAKYTIIFNSLNCNYEGFSGAQVIWTTYAFNRSAIVCQAFSLCFITAAVLPFLHIICFTSSYVSIRSCCSVGEKYAARVLSIFASVIL